MIEIAYTLTEAARGINTAQTAPGIYNVSTYNTQTLRQAPAHRLISINPARFPCTALANYIGEGAPEQLSAHHQRCACSAPRSGVVEVSPRSRRPLIHNVIRLPPRSRPALDVDTD